jgi:hypothetical protein
MISLPAPIESTRPPFLSTLFSLSSKKDNSDEDIYSRFLMIADKTQTRLQSSEMDITCSVKCDFTSVNENNGEVLKNGSLIRIFMYYAKLQSPTVIHSFIETDEANETMSQVEFILFLRDFQIIPKLLTKLDVIELWKLVTKEWIHTGKGTFRSMDFNSFKDMFVRLALFSYSKPGLSSLILQVNGYKILPTQKIDFFCKFFL